MIVELIPAVAAGIIGGLVISFSKSIRIIFKETFLHPFKRTSIKIRNVDGKKEYTVSRVS